MNFFQRFINRFRRNQRVYVFFICFLIAALFWFLLVLTKDYSSSLNVSVVYYNFPSGLVQVNRLPDKFMLNIKASGYDLMSLDEYDEGNKLNVDVTTLAGTEPGIKKIPSLALVKDIIQQLGSEVAIISIRPDTLIFDLSRSASVKLPVKATINITFDKQYDSVSAPKLKPDSVMVILPVSFVGAIDHIETEPISAESLHTSLSKKVRLISPEGVTLNTTEAEFSMEVEKFTEGTVQVPVRLVQVPQDLTVKIYPDVVLVKYLVSLSQFSQIKPEMFTVTVDASQASSVSGDKLQVEITAAPKSVRSVSCQPQQVDFILKK